MKQLGDWWWPDWDIHCGLVVPKEATLIPQYIEGLKNKRTCVQAGGNVGVYPQLLAAHFERVHTFEPHPDNFECLKRNVTAENVTSHFAALGDRFGTVKPFHDPGEERNCGATSFKDGPGAWITIGDRLPMGTVDFIMLDVEGWELPALRGLIDTIRRDRPLIAVELKGLGERFGWPDATVRTLLADLGYRFRQRIGRDELWSHSHA